MRKKKLIAMLLAGGQGSRLSVLTHKTAKPAVPFGGKYRIIDFPLSNCVNSYIDTVGVLTQYEPLALNAYLGSGQAWDLDRNSGGVYVLPPYVKEGSSGDWYSGTANAIYQNIEFIDQFNPTHVLILSGDHIYKMDYSEMLAFHEKNDADATIAVFRTPISEASRFGIMNTDENEKIIEFEEKPENPKSDRASMGVYIFKWSVLRKYLIDDENDEKSENDFGRNIIPNMLEDGLPMYAYSFYGYWKDVGTIASLYESNMDLLSDPPKLELYDPSHRIYSKSPIAPPHFVGKNGDIVHSIVTEGCSIYGRVEGSVLFAGVTVDNGAVVTDSVIMPNAKILKNAVVKKAIVGENAVVGAGAMIGTVLEKGIDNSMTGDITLIGNDVIVEDGEIVPIGMVEKEKYRG
ncbi:MAG: glucose-1-phosphate adenylyltransferase [Clostridia bacterium]